MRKLGLILGTGVLLVLVLFGLWILDRPERDTSIACRQVGPIKIIAEFKDGERVFDERRSLLFKTLQVVRFFDRARNVLVYVAYSNRIIEGSPKNSISSVPIMNWPGTQTSASQ